MITQINNVEYGVDHPIFAGLSTDRNKRTTKCADMSEWWEIDTGIREYFHADTKTWGEGGNT